MTKKKENLGSGTPLKIYIYSDNLLLLDWVYPYKVVQSFMTTEFDILFSVLPFHKLVQFLKEEVVDHHEIKARMFLHFHLLLPHSHFTANHLIACSFFNFTVYLLL